MKHYLERSLDVLSGIDWDHDSNSVQVMNTVNKQIHEPVRKAYKLNIPELPDS